MAAEFWFLLIVALAMTGRAARNLLVGRFPPLVDFAALSTVYYAVPLAVLGFLSINPRGLAFLHPAAADPALALASMRFVVLALLSLEAGRMLARIHDNPRYTLSFHLDHATEARVLLCFVGLLALFPLGVYLFGFAEFFTGYASEYYSPIATLGNAIIYSTVEALGFTIMLAVLLGERSGRVPLKAFIAASLLLLLFVLAVRAKRLEVVSALLPTAVLLIAMRPWLRRPLFRVALAGTGLLVLIVVSVLRVNDSFSWFNLFYYTFTEGVYAGHSLPGIEERLEALAVGYEHGARFLTAIIAFVPRFLWEGKDALVYQGDLALQGVSPLGATTFLAETVLQGGFVAVAIVYATLGFFFQQAMKFERVWDAALDAGLLPMRFAFYIVALVIFIPHFRDGIIPAIKLAVQSLTVFVLITGVHYQMARRRVDAFRGSRVSLMPGNGSLQVLSVKAFGDFVIALGAAERVADTATPWSILAADHLRPLAQAMAPRCAIRFLDNAERDVPALFDVRRAGLGAAARSAISLRRAVTAGRAVDTTLLIDKAGWRERWLARGAGDVVALPAAANIYGAYDALADGRVGAVEDEAATGQKVGVFPGSRVAAKNLPIALVRDVIDRIGRQGREARLFLLDGERPDLEAADLPHVRLPRRFEAVASAIDSVGAVVGADSLPVHIAERAKRPVFVLSPRDNSYWLPWSSFRCGWWATFDGVDRRKRLTQFCERP